MKIGWEGILEDKREVEFKKTWLCVIDGCGTKASATPTLHDNLSSYLSYYSEFLLHTKMFSFEIPKV